MPLAGTALTGGIEEIDPPRLMPSRECAPSAARERRPLCASEAPASIRMQGTFQPELPWSAQCITASALPPTA